MWNSDGSFIPSCLKKIRLLSIGMWIISKPIEQDNELTSIAYHYGEERWLDGLLIGTLIGSLIGYTTVYIAIRLLK